jgi:DNA-binding MarR family transcriptional regulator
VSSVTSAPEARIADALADIREATWRLGPLMRSVYRTVMSDVMAAHHLIPLLERVPGVRTSDLARGRGVAMSTVSRQVDQLVQQGWVRIEPDPEDQRAHRLYLTDEATRRLATAREDIAVLCERRLGTERAARLIDAANALREAVDALADLSDQQPCPFRTAETPDPSAPDPEAPGPSAPDPSASDPEAPGPEASGGASASAPGGAAQPQLTS